VDTTELPVVPAAQPFSSEHEAQMRQSLVDLAAVHDVAARAAAAGVDVSQHQQRAAAYTHAASSLLQSFFPTTLTPPKE
jgi:hypothetical protein